MSEISNRTPEEIQSEIVATRRSLDRKLDELGHRLDPRVRIDEVRARATDAVDSARERASDALGSARNTLSGAGEKLHPRNFEPYVGWMAVGAVVGGTVMAIKGWRRTQCGAMDNVDEVTIGTDVTLVNTSDLGDLPPAP
jgi:hypothetical protein